MAYPVLTFLQAPLRTEIRQSPPESAGVRQSPPDSGGLARGGPKIHRFEDFSKNFLDLVSVG